MTRLALVRCLALTASLGTAPAHAGDPEGLDPELHHQCIRAAASEGELIDCAGKGVDACRAFWHKRDPARDPFVILSGCTDDERQLWEADLSAAYDALLGKAGLEKTGLAKAGDARSEVVADLRAMQRAWIAFRDARCRAERGLFGHGTGGAIAVPECEMRETARQTALLRALLRE